MVLSLINDSLIQVSQQTGRASANALRVLGILRQRPVLTLKYLRDEQGMTFPTVTKAVQTLITAGIVRELTGQRRNRVFVYDGYLDILNEGGLPL
jgi:DNA-binding MarR family transcriptional regulator